MKNFFISVFATAALAALMQSFLPWWTVAIAAFTIAFFISQKPLSAFGAGFLAIFLLWTVYAFTLSSGNENILAGKVAELLKALTGGKILTLYIITGLIGGLVSGFAALTGNFAAALKK